MRIRATVLLAALSVLGVSLHAQSVQGTARYENTNRPVAGAVVQLLDSSRAVVARTLTSSGGVFVLRAPLAGRYELRVLRIGFQAYTKSLRIAQDTTVMLTLNNSAWTLAQFKVEDSRQCRTRSDSARLTAQIWEEISKALLSTQITRENANYRFVAAHHRRLYDGALSMRTIELTDRTSVGLSPWASFPPDSLARNGYARERGDTMTFVAPDIDVLLSNSFANTHCVRLANYSPTAPTITIEFEPLPSLRNSDIKGRLTVNRQTRELSALDFQYTNLPFTTQNRLAGGHIEFRRLDDGAWITPQWIINAPVPERVPVVAPQTAGTFRAQSDLATQVRRTRRATAFYQTSGADLREVYSKSASDSTLIWKGATSTVDVTVQTDDAPAVGALVQITGSAMAKNADAKGVARFESLFPGLYRVEATTADLQSLGVAPTIATVAVGEKSSHALLMNVRSLESAVRSVCRGAAVTANAAVLTGTVLSNDAPVAGAKIMVTWQTAPGTSVPKSALRPAAGGDAADTTKGAQITVTLKNAIPMVARATTDQNGRYAVCGVSTNSALSVVASANNQTTEVQLHIPAGVAVANRALVLRP